MELHLVARMTHAASCGHSHAIANHGGRGAPSLCLVLQVAPTRPDGRSPSTRAVQLACLLADLVAAGLPLDAAAMSAGVVAEAAAGGWLGHEQIAQHLGGGVAALVHDIVRVRLAPQRIELFDDNAAR